MRTSGAATLCRVGGALRAVTQDSSFLAILGFKLGSLRDAIAPELIARGSSFLAILGFKLGSLRDAFAPALITRGSSCLATLGCRMASLQDTLTRSGGALVSFFDWLFAVGHYDAGPMTGTTL